MAKGSGGGGRSGRGGGGGGADMTTPPSQMSDEQLVSSIKALDKEYVKTATELQAARESGNKERRNMLRQLSNTIEIRQEKLLSEASMERKALQNRITYERGRPVGIK